MRSTSRLCRRIGLWPQLMWCARVATSDAFDSPQGSEDYRDVFEKPRASTHSAPRRRRPQNKEAVLRRLCFARQPDQTPTAEASEKQGRTTGGLCFSRPSAASPAPIARASLAHAGWRRLVGLPQAERSVPTAGGFVLRRRRLLETAVFAKPCKPNTGAIAGVDLYRTRVRYRVS